MVYVDDCRAAAHAAPRPQDDRMKARSTPLPGLGSSAMPTNDMLHRALTGVDLWLRTTTKLVSVESAGVIKVHTSRSTFFSRATIQTLCPNRAAWWRMRLRSPAPNTGFRVRSASWVSTWEAMISCLPLRVRYADMGRCYWMQTSPVSPPDTSTFLLAARSLAGNTVLEKSTWQK